MISVRLKPGRDSSLKSRHPWVFSGALQKLPAGLEPGTTVIVTGESGATLALGAFSPKSQIAIRVWSFAPDTAIDAEFFGERIRAAVARRGTAPEPDSARRLVNGESDGLPGFIVDQYGRYLVCQFLAAGVERWRDAIVSALVQHCEPAGIWERSDVDVRRKEGLEMRTGLLWGNAPPEDLTVLVAGQRFIADLRAGHKTGLYLDQSENLPVVAEFSRGREVLNGFAYTGAFTVAALRGGAARVTSIESSQAALDRIAKHVQLNGFDLSGSEPLCADVAGQLRTFRDSRRAFDLAVLDPPKFVANAAQLIKGGRAYKDINLLALKLLRPGGVLITFSCSGHVTPDLFQKIVADAAVDSGRNVRIIRWLSQAADHPVATSFPEGRYLKGLVCRVD
ncbi:MAG: class I SAM-dependent methyltransferase [Gammaproteobacteria bacterium]|nr:class I SAM-dependent methyltransferase [Gammaproteobacteria bacterium]